MCQIVKSYQTIILMKEILRVLVMKFTSIIFIILEIDNAGIFECIVPSDESSDDEAHDDVLDNQEDVQ